MSVSLALTLAAAGSEWAVMPFTVSEGLWEERDTFHLLLSGELRDQGVRLHPGGKDLEPCASPSCGAGGARHLDVGWVVVGSLSRFGNKLVVSALLIRGDDGRTVEEPQLVIDGPDDLDVAARRLARALVTGESPEATRELGALTKAETEPIRRQQGTSGLSLSLGAFFPLQDTYGDTNGGLAVDVGYWYEALHFAIEPSIGVRFSTDTTRGRSFFEIPVEVGAYWILSTGDFAPFIGGGAGLRYLNETRPRTLSLGNVIRTEHEGEVSEDRFGAGVFGRAGFLLFRTHSLRVSVSARYGVTFVDLNDAGFAQAVSGHLTVHF